MLGSLSEKFSIGKSVVGDIKKQDIYKAAFENNISREWKICVCMCVCVCMYVCMYKMFLIFSRVIRHLDIRINNEGVKDKFRIQMTEHGKKKILGMMQNYALYIFISYFI